MADSYIICESVSLEMYVIIDYYVKMACLGEGASWIYLLSLVMDDFNFLAILEEDR